jgi:hypothetical protein
MPGNEAGPSDPMLRGFFGSDAGAGRARLAVIDMECFYLSARRAAFSSASVAKFRMQFSAL